MKMIFKNVKLHNFMSYEDATIKLDRNGFILVSGINNNPDDNAKSNGTGKSTIFSAISWAITGLTVSGGKEVANIYLDGTTSVELDFILDGTDYKLIRTKNPSNLKVFVNDEDKSGKGIRDTEKILSEMLPDITHSLLNSVIILGQGLPQKFTNNSPSGRKEVLEKLSNSDFMIQDLKNRVNEREKQLKINIRECEDEALKAETTKSTNIDLTNKYKNQLSELNSLNISDIEKQIEDNENEVDKHNNDITLLEVSAETLREKISHLNDDLKDHNDRVFAERQNLELIDSSELTKKQTDCEVEIRTLKQEIYRLDNIKDTCPTCGQKLPDVHKVDTTEQKNKLTELEILKNKYTSQIKDIDFQNTQIINEFNTRQSETSKVLNAKVSELTRQLNDCNTDIRNHTSSVMSINAIITNLKVQIDNYNTQRDTLIENINDVETSISKLDEKILYYNNKKDNIQEHLSVINKMNTALKRDFRGYLLTNVIDYISKQAKSYSQELFSTDKLDFELDGNNISIKYDNKDYEVLSGGEKQKVDVIIQLSIRDMLCTFLNFSSNILVLDEVTDNLDIIGSQKMFNLISTRLNDVEAIYIVSHHTDFEIPVDSEITVMKGSDKISRII